MARSSAFAEWFDIRPWEVRRAVLAVLGAFLILAFVILSRALRETFLLSAYAIRYLPWMTVSVVVTGLPTVIVFGRMLGRYHPRAVIRWATVTQTGANAESLLSREAITSGTPAFMAPEIILGAEDIDGHADIYALGCVAYWLLTGELIFNGRSAAELLAKQVQEQPVRPSLRTELDVPVELERLIMACLEKDPARRPASARTLAQKLTALDLEKDWAGERAAEWWDLHEPTDGPAKDRGSDTTPKTLAKMITVTCKLPWRERFVTA